MRYFVGFVFLLVGIYAWIGWAVASHTGIDFDPLKIDNWFLLLLVVVPIYFGLKLLFNPLIKRIKNKKDS